MKRSCLFLMAFAVLVVYQGFVFSHQKEHVHESFVIQDSSDQCRPDEAAMVQIQKLVQSSSNPEALVSVLGQLVQQESFDEGLFLDRLEKNQTGAFDSKALFLDFLQRLPSDLYEHHKFFSLMKQSLSFSVPPGISPTLFRDKTICITGGGGYIGKVVTSALLEAGVKKVIIVDISPRNLEIFSEAIRAKRVEVFQGTGADIHDETLLEKALANDGRPCDGVIHLAAFIAAGSSTKRPAQYFYDNVIGTQILLKVMQKLGIDVFSFASSAGVFSGVENNRNGFLSKEQLIDPQNPYGETKGLMEKLMANVENTNYCALRFFNVAGAVRWNEAWVGEDHFGLETHVIPRALQAYLTKKISFQIFGTDYATRDGTAIRDYIHIQDLAQAIIRSLAVQFQSKEKGMKCRAIVTLGSGAGTSVQEIATGIEDKIREKTGDSFHFNKGPRRIGDPRMLLASGLDAFLLFGWLPQHGIHTILDDAWEIHLEQYKNHQVNFDDSASPEFQDKTPEEEFVRTIHHNIMGDSTISPQVQFEILFRLFVDLLRQPALAYRHVVLSPDQQENCEAIVRLASSLFTQKQDSIDSVRQSEQLQFRIQELLVSVECTSMSTAMNEVWASLVDRMRQSQ